MDLRATARGTVSWSRIEGLGTELIDRLAVDTVRIEFLEHNNWLSTPLVVNDRWFVKVITQHNARVHALLAGARNIGAAMSGAPGFFERYAGPIEMAEHERTAIDRLRSIGIKAPQPVTAFGYDGLGVVVLEYLPEFETPSALSRAHQTQIAEVVFESLAVMHDHDIVHGDLREENLLVVDGELYFVDSTIVEADQQLRAEAYDLASALAVFSPLLGPEPTTEIAARSYPPDHLAHARRFLEFVNLRPDHDFDPVALSRAIDQMVV